MSDAAGRLSAALADRYRIERELGAGGMATVYLAEDLKHDRKVAIKVLKPELAAVLGADRFVQEIKTTAALSHPHILPLFDSGDAGGFLFYVMPYVEGETLRAKLDRETQLGVDEAVKITTEVADALQYAHEHGVVHRDIKPENILLHAGRPMVADFGIALAVSAAAGGRMTETGLSLGTPHYMSPEQATAEKAITNRSDVYSLASVLYEMLTGQPPHLGGSAQQIIMKIVTEQALPVTQMRKSVPPNVEAATARALEKLPADRFESAKAFADALANPGFRLAGAARAAAGAGIRSPRGSRRWRYVAAVSCATLAVVAGLGWFRPRPMLPTSRQHVVLWQHPIGRLLSPGQAVEATQAAIAPDGSSIVYVDSTGGKFHLVRKLRGDAVGTTLTGTDGAVSPFFSPDGRWIGYITVDSKLKKIPIGGGGSVTLTDADATSADHSTAAAWLDDDSIVFQGDSGLVEVGANGGPVHVRLRSMMGHNAITMWPLPKSRGVVYTRCLANCSVESSIHVLDLRSDSDRVLVPNAAGAWYSPTGDLLYTARGGGLYAMAFDAQRLKVTGGPVPVIPDVVPGTFTLSASGAVLYTIATGAGALSELMWVAPNGSAVPLDSTWKADFQYPALSPDGKRLAVSVVGATTQLWIRRSDGTRQQLTQDGIVNWRPAWTHDGQSVVFSSNRRGPDMPNAYALYEQPADGSAPARLLVADDRYSIWEGEMSPDGRWLAFRRDQEGVPRIWARRMEGDTALVGLRTTPASESNNEVALSPDGRWLAYLAYSDGRNSIRVAPFPAMAPIRVISPNSGSEPRWSRDGRTLYYRSADRMMAVPVTPGPPLDFGPPRELFSAVGYRSARNRQEYDVAPDGRFVMIRNLPDTSNAVIYVENWFPELVAKVKK